MDSPGLANTAEEHMDRSAIAGRRRRGAGRLIVLGVAAVLLAGCANTIAGLGTADPLAIPPEGKPLGYTPSDFEIKYAEADGPDQIVRDSLDDIIKYYKSFFPDVFGKDFQPPKGGYFSIQPGEKHASGCMDGPDDPTIVDNAFYCSFADEVAYYRPLIDRYASQYSDMQVGLVLAHEMGHAIQAREGLLGERSIVKETQADCFAGTWARAVKDGLAPHFKYNEANMDKTLLAWALELPDEVGSDPNQRGAHGSAFDRVSAMQEGYQQGPKACRDNFNDSRVFTSAQFDTDPAGNASDDGQGNATYENSVLLAQRVFDVFYAAKFPDLGGTWANPPVLVGGSGDPTCTSQKVVSYCQANNSVVISNEQALRDVHDRFGDYAVVTALGFAYGDAALTQLGYSLTDPQAVSAVSCLTGALSGDLAANGATVYQATLSPGDFDEATVMLLSADKDSPTVDTGDLSAFARMDAFRDGVNAGAGNCGV